MKKYLSLLILLSVQILTAVSPDLVVAERGKSAYKIVYADSGSSPEVNALMKRSAETLQKIVRLSTGATLPVVPEESFRKDSPAIYVGKVSILEKTGPEKRWASHIMVKDRDIYLWGEDRHFPQVKLPESAAYRSFIAGTHAAVLRFGAEFAGAVYLILPELKYSVPFTGKLTVPAGYRHDNIPKILYTIARGKNLNYDLGNNFRAAPWNRSFGGHSHNLAVPWDKYWKTHPEYFFKQGPDKPRNGWNVRPQYCLSNPAVQKLIYQHILSELDKGYEQTQLGQSDSFHVCYCRECIKARGQNSPGEFLWRMHRDMALRLMKDRPGKKVVIMAYGPTWQPPKTFDSFPPNVIIELASFNLKNAAEPGSVWQQWMKFPNAKASYLYSWGFYNFAGFTPNRSIAYLSNEVELYRNSGVIGIYRCGFGELPGLEGPSYFIFGQRLDDPDADIGLLLKKYCRQAFGKGGPVMEKFFTRLDQAVKSKDPEISDWDKDINPSRRQFRRYDLELLAARYPESCLKELGSLLDRAEALEKTPMLKILRTEFTLLKLSAECAGLFHKAVKHPDAASAAALMNAVYKRSEFIDALPVDKRGSVCMEGVAMFGGSLKPVLKNGGRLCCLFNAPFIWNVGFMKEKSILPIGRTLTADGRDMQYLVPRCVDDKTDATVNFKRTVQVKAERLGSRLKITLTGKNLDPKTRKNLRIRIKLGPDKNGRHQIFGHFGNGPLSDSVPGGIVKRKGIMGQQENWIASKTLRPLVKCPEPDIAEITVPLDKLCKNLPVPGEKWLFNVTVYVPNRTYAGGLVWECALDQLDWEQSFEREGLLLFPK